MSKVRSDNISNRANDGAPKLVFGAEVPVGYGITGAGGINITCSLIKFDVKLFLSDHFKYILLNISAQSWLSVPPAPACISI